MSSKSAPRPTKVLLTSSEGTEFLIDRDIADMSQLLKCMFQDIGEIVLEPVPLPNVSGPILTKVIEYCTHHRNDPNFYSANDDLAAEIAEWDLEFCKVDQGTLYELILAANYLDIKPLLDLTCKTVANMIKAKTPEEIRRTFGIVNDFSPEEEDQARRENAFYLSMPEYKFETIQVTFPIPFVAHVELSRAKKMNAINSAMWVDIRSVFDTLRDDPDVRAIVLSGAGRCFTSGLDMFSLNLPVVEDDPSRTAFKIRLFLKALQDSLSAIERCDKAVIAAIHGPCIGGGIDISTACDIRYASKDAYFSVKEVDIGLAADVGTLQRLPKVVGNISWVRELCLTARNFDANEALEFGFISKILPDHAKVLEAAIATATLIAEKSPIAVNGTKHLLNYSRDHSVQEGLDYTAAWNMVMLTTPDLPTAAAASMQKQKPTFAKL
ncbi:hypothetical protein BGZ65_000364 [Modicella reniformis]|uniref:Uncharacterized protein n=1 Tax=Modicella reniformis TaxID=1440133 RepID=A0A9P6MK10_9FUNG|nr:hypothetical protein BGZ65_000364 [Modicella reniformis]